ncbi:hypothetical protein KW787_02065 [Candidatus Pacearchaeota archaeon]|nr:hypothetical protein [Candidatus Pacearchaeota archaeon]
MIKRVRDITMKLADYIAVKYSPTYRNLQSSNNKNKEDLSKEKKEKEMERARAEAFEREYHSSRDTIISLENAIEEIEEERKSWKRDRERCNKIIQGAKEAAQISYDASQEILEISRNQMMGAWQKRLTRILDRDKFRELNINESLAHNYNLLFDSYERVQEENTKLKIDHISNALKILLQSRENSDLPFAVYVKSGDKHYLDFASPTFQRDYKDLSSAPENLKKDKSVWHRLEKGHRTTIRDKERTLQIQPYFLEDSMAALMVHVIPESEKGNQEYSIKSKGIINSVRRYWTGLKKNFRKHDFKPDLNL